MAALLVRVGLSFNQISKHYKFDKKIKYMASIVNVLSTFYWSGDIPDLTISVTGSIDVAIDVDGTEILRLTLFSNSSNQAQLVELAELVEQRMVDAGAIHSVVTVSDVSGSTSTQLCQFDVVYSVADMEMGCYEFCETNFLTSVRSKRLVDDVLEKLYYYDPTGAESDILHLQVGYNTDGAVRVKDVDDSSSTLIRGSSSVPTCNYVEFTVADIMELADVDNVVFITLHLGDREMNYFTLPLSPDATFLFRNYFNAPELLPLNCVTEKKQAGSRNVAQVRRSSVLASVTHETEYEVETAPLSNDEALLVEQLCESPSCYVLPSCDEIVISSRTCEFSDERGKLPTGKFTWRYLHGRGKGKADVVVDDGIFSDEYNTVFD